MTGRHCIGLLFSYNVVNEDNLLSIVTLDYQELISELRRWSSGERGGHGVYPHLGRREEACCHLS